MQPEGSDRGKLIALGRWYATPKRKPPDTRGIPEDLLRQIEAAKRASGTKGVEQVEIYRENWGAFQLFLQMRTCWKVHGFSGQYLGLDYRSLPYFGAWRDAQDQSALEDKLRVLERAALDQWADDRD